VWIAACLWAGAAGLILFAVYGKPTLFPGTGELAFQSKRDGNWEIYALDIDTHLAHNLTRSPADDLNPSWSLKTGQIAFHTNREGGPRFEIYAMDGNSGAVRRIGGSPNGNNWRASWSPDGARLVFMVNYSGIRLMEADGSHIQELTYGFSPVWSPVSDQIAYYADHPPTDLNSDVLLVNADGHAYHRLTDNPLNDWGPTWSPDGTQIAYVSSRDGNDEIYVMQVDSADCAVLACDQSPKRLTFNSAMDSAPAWSPDGRYIAFQSERDGHSEIYLMGSDGSRVQRLTFGDADNRFPTWGP
jgi:TolB protein